MKKLLAFILVIFMLAGTLTSCGKLHSLAEDFFEEAMDIIEGANDGFNDEYGGNVNDDFLVIDPWYDETENRIEIPKETAPIVVACNHADGSNDGDHVCDYGCGTVLTSCEDNDKNHKCDDCQIVLTQHDYSNGYCIVCGENQPQYTRIGNKLTFGSYPQSKVTDSELISDLNGKAGDLPESADSRAWTPYGYYIDGNAEKFMWYIDVAEGDERYRGVYFTSYRPYYYDCSSTSRNTYQDDNGYEKDEVYWFKYEPISWTIFNENTTDGIALILCDMIIDSQAYQDEYEYDMEYYYNISSGVPSGTYANNYAESTIRKWLNDTFYNTAFSDLQKELILVTAVNNGELSTGYIPNNNICENTQDKIFLLSYAEARGEIYGLESATARQKNATDYSKAQGIYMYENGCSSWWLRSPTGYAFNYSSFTSYVGDISIGNRIDITYVGVAPALNIKL